MDRDRSNARRNVRRKSQTRARRRQMDARDDLQAIERFRSRGKGQIWLSILYKVAAGNVFNAGMPAMARQMALLSIPIDTELVLTIGNLADAAAVDGKEEPWEIF